MKEFKINDIVGLDGLSVRITDIVSDTLIVVTNPNWNWDEEALYLDSDDDYDEPYLITVNVNDLD